MYLSDNVFIQACVCALARMGLNVFHMFENLHDVCLEDGRLLVMPCNDGCKELHPDIGTPHESG